MEPIEMRDGIGKGKGERGKASGNHNNELSLQFVLENGRHELKQHYWIYDGNRYIQYDSYSIYDANIC